MIAIGKVAWVVCEDVSYQNFLYRYASCRGYQPVNFFKLSECHSRLLKASHVPDLILIGAMDGEDGSAEAIRELRPALDVLQFSLVKLMALRQQEASRDCNQVKLTGCGSSVRLANVLKLIELLESIKK